MSDAITRKESLLKSIADGTSSSLKPITREEQYLAYIAGESKSFPTTPITREEAFLDKIAKRGAGGGGSTINVQPLTVTENGTWDAPDGQAYDPVTVDVKAVTEPITITENGVYPVPKVSGGTLDYGKEATFKNKITVEEITNYLDGVGFEIQTDATQSMLMYTLEDGTLMIGWSNGVLIPQEAGYHIMVVPNEAEITGTGYSYLAGFPSYPGGGWYAINAVTGKIIPYNFPITVAFATPDPDRPYMATPDFELLSVFFNIETKSLDGWGDITVNVAGGGGAELNIAYGDTAPEDTSKLWVKTTQPSAVKVAKELQKVFEEGSSTVTTAGGSATMNYGTWAPMGNRIYGFGGNQGGSYTTNIFYYDTSTEQKVTLGATLPVNVCLASACACGAKIYLFGGRNGPTGDCLNTIYCLDTQTDTLTTLSATLSQTLRATASAAYGTKIYIFGGSNGDTRINAIQCLDCETETISTLSTVLPAASSNFAISNYGDYIYLFGGYKSQQSIWKFDCKTETIDIVNTTLPVYLSDGCAATIAKSIFVFGYSNQILCFDIEAETIKTLSATMPNTLNYPRALATEDDKIYIVSDKTPYCFSLDMKIVLDNGTLQIQSAFSENLFNLINTETAQVEIGVKAIYKGNADGIGEVVEASLHNGTSWVTI